MNTTTTTAAAEAAKNLAIYNAVADHARHAFEFLNINPGQYTPAQIVAELKKSRAAWKDNAPAVGDEGGLVRVAVDAFACSFPLLSAFDVLAQLATAYDIQTRDRVTFERAAETAPAVVSFMVPTAAADVAKAVAKKAPDRQALTFAYLDTERRALVGTDGHVLTVAAIPSLQVAEGARRGYLVARGLLKADRVTIDTNNNATDGHNVAESPDWLRFPVWSPVFPDVYDTDAMTFDSTTRRALTKAVAAAAKYATPDLKDTRHVAIFGEAGTDRLTIRARREIATPTPEDPNAVKYEYMDTAVQLPATLSRSLAFAFHGPDFATLPAFDTLYITPNESRAAVVISKRAAAVLVPQPLPDGFERICTTDERPAFAVQLHPLADLLDVYTDAPDTLTAAPAADDSQDTDTTTTTPAQVISESESQDTTTTAAQVISEIESEPTAAAPAADSHQDTPADHLTPAELRALVAAERERLADTINTDTDPDAPAFAVGEAFELLTDTGATVAARVRSQYYNNDDDTAAPCWLYLCDCDPWTDRHGVTIDGGTYDAARMRKAAPAAADGHQDTPAAPAADGHQSESEADTLPVTYYDPAAGVIVWGLADELPTADLLTIESERESAVPADGHQDTTTTAHDSESRPRALLLTLTRAALRLAAVVAALLLLTFANDRPTPATATTTAADLLAPADHQDTPAEVISEPTESEPTARPAADRPAVEKRHHARENKRESRAELMTAAAPTADLLTADTLTAPALVVDTLQAARNITETADTLSAAPAADIESDTDDETPAPVLTITDESDDDTNDDGNGTSTTGTTTTGNGATTGTTTAPAPVVVVIVYGVPVPVCLPTL